MNKILWAFVFSALCLMPLRAYAGSTTVSAKDASGTSRSFDVTTDGSGNYVPWQVICDYSAAANCATIDSNHALAIAGEGSAGTAAGGILTVQGVANMTPLSANAYQGGSAVGSGNPLQVTLANTGSNSTAVLVTGTGGTFPVSQATASNLNATVVGTGTFAVQATLQASATTAIGKVDPNTIASWGLMSGTTPGTAPTNTLLVGSIYNSSAPSPSNGNTLPLQSDSAGRLIVNCGSGCGGSGGTSIADEASFTQGTTSLTPVGGIYVTSVTNLTAGQAGAVRLTNTRWMMIDQPGSEVAIGGATAATNAIQAGGVYNSSAPSLSNGNGAALQLTSAGSLHTTVDNSNANGRAAASSSSPVTLDTGVNISAGSAAGGSLIQVGGSDGTDARIMATDSSGHPIVAGVGTAGSASGGVLTVQGVASMTPLLVTQSGNGDACFASAKLGASINLTASGQVITGASGKKTYICSIDLVSATAQNIALVEGTGTTCATNIYGLAGGTTAATGWNLVANGGLTKGGGVGTVYSPSGDSNGTDANICLLLSGTGQTSGQITYVQQ